MMISSQASAAEKRVVILGDSLTAGYGLENGQSFPDQLQMALRNDGLGVTIDNAGVSGDTTAGGLSRLDWAVDNPPKPDLVIVALGANDMLRGIDVKVTKDNLSKILERLKEKEITTLLAGMKAPTQYTLLFQNKFDAIYPELAKEYDVALYPFFLDGVALNPDLNQADGIHPNQKGVAIMVENMKPLVKEILEK
jgi:acyl-CoA thioesterase-1